MTTETPTYLYLDSHVHFYTSWGISLDDFLSLNFHNLEQAYKTAELADTLPGICLLDTRINAAPVTELLEEHTAQQDRIWSLSPCESEPNSIWAASEGHKMLILLGQQINTSEGLELLRIGDMSLPTSGVSIHEILAETPHHTWNIIPWAVGKWLGKRGEVVQQCLEKYPRGRFHLGDNGGRPWFWKNIKPFIVCQEKNLPIVNGSDPLPVTNGYQTSGTFGNCIPVQLDIDRPFVSLDQAFSNKALTPFGKLSTAYDFVRNQVALRV